MKARSLLLLISVTILIALCLSDAHRADGFEITGWFYDPVSVAIETYTSDCPTESVRVSHILDSHGDYLNWLDSLRVSYFCTRDPSYAHWAKGDLAAHRIAVAHTFGFSGQVAANYMTIADRYAHSQCKYMGLSQKHVISDFAYDDEWTAEPPRDLQVDQYWNSALGAYTRPIDNAGVVWDYSPIGRWIGWKTNHPDHPCMPLHFRVTCGADEDLQNSEPIVAKVYFARSKTVWVCPDYIEPDGDTCRYCCEYLRYPPIAIPIDSFAGSYNQLRVLEFTLDPSIPGVYDHLGYNHNVVSSETRTDTIRSDSSSWCQLMVRYEGNHTFYLQKIEVCDDDYYRMVYAPPAVRESVADSIWTSLTSCYDELPNGLAGWAGDDFATGWVPGLAQVLSILYHHHQVSPMFLSAYSNISKFQGYMRALGLPEPDQALEFYPFGRDSTCTPSYPGNWPLDAMFTRGESDEPYLDIIKMRCAPCGEARYNGSRSLQCALDEDMWGTPPIFPNFVPENSRVHFESFVGRTGMIHGIEDAHFAGAKATPLLLTGAFGMEADICWDQSAQPSRAPTPNELKLSAWLTVASDADGLSWYGLTAHTYPYNATQYIEGLFDWYESGSDSTPISPDSPERRNFCHTKYLKPTPRYYAAKEVTHDILQIANVVEPLDFKATYASRAFKENYPYDGLDHRWVQRDQLQGTSRVEAVHAAWPQKHPEMPIIGGWVAEHPDDTYVQVSHFEQPGNTSEDYYFLIVNRRALDNIVPTVNPPVLRESRKVTLEIGNVAEPGGLYMVEELLHGTSRPADWASEIGGRKFTTSVIEPGEAELVHFYRADTTDLVITQDTTIKAPAYFHRNIIVQNGNVTIVPDTAKLKHWVHNSEFDEEGVQFYDTVAPVTFWPGKGIVFESPLGLGDSWHHRIHGVGDTRLRFQSANADRPWKGIEVAEGVSLNIKECDIQGATTGLFIEGGIRTAHGGYIADSLTDVSIHDCGTGLSLTTQARVEVRRCGFEQNETGILSANSTLNMFKARICDNSLTGLYLYQTTAHLQGINIDHNGWKTSVPSVWNVGLYSHASAVDLRGCVISANRKEGIYAFGTSMLPSAVTMGDPGQSTPQWGRNTLIENDSNKMQIRVVGGNSIIILEDGYNHIEGEHAGAAGLWITCPAPAANCTLPWGNNYWGEISLDSLRLHIPAFADVEPMLIDANACVYDPDEEMPQNEESSVPYLAAKQEEAKVHDADAIDKFKYVLSESGCFRDLVAIREIVAANVRLGESVYSVAYFDSLASAAENTTRLVAARLAQAASLAYGGNTGSARMLLEQMLVDPQDDTTEVETKIALVNLDLIEQNLDNSRPCYGRRGAGGNGQHHLPVGIVEPLGPVPHRVWGQRRDVRAVPSGQPDCD